MAVRSANDRKREQKRRQTSKKRKQKRIEIKIINKVSGTDFWILHKKITKFILQQTNTKKL